MDAIKIQTEVMKAGKDARIYTSNKVVYMAPTGHAIFVIPIEQCYLNTDKFNFDECCKTLIMKFGDTTDGKKFTYVSEKDLKLFGKLNRLKFTISKTNPLYPVAVYDGVTNTFLGIISSVRIGGIEVSTSK